MQAIKKYIKENPFTAWMLIISIILLNAGLLMIQYSHRTPDVPFQNQGSQAALEVPTLETSTEATTTEVVEQSISLITTDEVSPFSHLTQEEIAKALSREKVGSDIWCDLMLAKNDRDWRDDEIDIFAKSCI